MPMVSRIYALLALLSSVFPDRHTGRGFGNRHRRLRKSRGEGTAKKPYGNWHAPLKTTQEPLPSEFYRRITPPFTNQYIAQLANRKTKAKRGDYGPIRVSLGAI